MTKIIIAAIISLFAPIPVEPSGADFCCTRCENSGGNWSCSGCSAGSFCAGDVFTCLGEYTGGGSCKISDAANTCCE